MLTPKLEPERLILRQIRNEDVNEIIGTCLIY